MKHTSFALYIHVPFCVRKCPYCAFSSCEIGAGNEALVAQYLDTLDREAELLSQEQHWKGMEAHSLFLGGGTPSLLTPAQVSRLVSIAERHFRIRPDAERTLEINPGTFDGEKAVCWCELGFNRVSLGVQSLDRPILKRLGRIHDAEQARKAFQLLRNAGFDNVGVDLIFGVQTARVARDEARGRHEMLSIDDEPCTTCFAQKHSHQALVENYDAWQATLEEVIRWQPEHVSAYGLTIEDGTPYAMAAQRGQDEFKLAEDLEVRQYETTMRLLREAGFEHYEVSNWATPGKRCRQNVSYWDGSSYLGIGPAAHSFEAAGKRRFWNQHTLSEWLNSVDSTGFGQAGEEVLTPLQQFEEAVMLGLRLRDGVEESKLQNLAQKADITWPPAALVGFLDRGYLERHAGNLRYTDAGIKLADAIEVALSEP